MTDQKNRILSFEEICAADDLETRTEYVPEWGGSVILQTMTGDKRDNYVQLLQTRMAGSGTARKLSNCKDLTARLCQLSLINEDGTPLFTMDQIKSFQEKNGHVITRLTAIAQEMNGLNDKEVTKQAKNSESNQSQESGTASPQDSVAQLPKQSEE